MEERINLDAAAAFGKRQAVRNDGTPPASTPDMVTAEHADVLLLREQVRNTRSGLALCLSAIFPGLGPLFMGSYIAAVVYPVIYIATLYKAFAGLLDLRGSFGIWWAVGALVVWISGIVHTVILLDSEV